MCALLTFLLLCAAEATGRFAPLFFLPLAFCMLPLCEERLYVHLILCDLLIAAASASSRRTFPFGTRCAI